MPHSSAWRPVVALLPTLPALGVLAAVVRVYRRVDELERRQLLESLGIAFAGTALVTFAYGFPAPHLPPPAKRGEDWLAHR